MSLKKMSKALNIVPCCQPIWHDEPDVVYRIASFSSTRCTWRPLVLNGGPCASWMDSSDIRGWFVEGASLPKILDFGFEKSQGAEQL